MGIAKKALLHILEAPDSYATSTSLRGALIAGAHKLLLKRKREREHARDAEVHSWRQFRKGQDLVHGDGLNAPRKSAKQRDRIERLTNTGEWKPRSEFDSLPKSEMTVD